MTAPLIMFNGYPTMTYGNGDKIAAHGCEKSTTNIQFVCDNVIPEGVGVCICTEAIDLFLF